MLFAFASVLQANVECLFYISVIQRCYAAPNYIQQVYPQVPMQLG